MTPSGPRHNNAEEAPAEPLLERPAGGTPLQGVIVLDTGLVPAAYDPGLAGLRACTTGPVSMKGTLASHDDVPDDNVDRWLDPVAGHGTFIASIVARLVPGIDVQVGKVLHPTGEGDDVELAMAVRQLLAEPPAVLCLACTCFTEDDVPPPALAEAIADLQVAGTVVVCAAGNEQTARPSWPAALPGVRAVGALGPDGPAPFTNYGAWVRACAPGTDVVGRFFTSVDDPDEGQVPIAYVCFATGRSAGEDELKSFLATQIAEFKIPARILAIDALPLTHSGKIDHKALAARWAGEAAR